MFAHGGGRILLESERLNLRPWEAGDWLEFGTIAADPDVMRYIGDGTPWPAERSRQFVQRQISLFEERGFCLWKLSARLQDCSPLIGFCGLQPLPQTETERDEIEIGWWLARAWWGRGLATEAALVAMRDGFERLGLQRIVAIAQPANTASIGITRKLGMRFERLTHSRGIAVAMYAREAP
jgi:RimJ/RimL family protein N-acetyltransferase